MVLQSATLVVALGAAACTQAVEEDGTGVDPTFDALCDDVSGAPAGGGSGGSGSTSSTTRGGSSATGGTSPTPSTAVPGASSGTAGAPSIGTSGSSGTAAPSGTSGSSATPAPSGTSGSGALPVTPAPAGAVPPSSACTGAACQCSDGIDNDGDGLKDWQYDLGCTSKSDGSEGGFANGTLEDGWTVLNPSADTRVTYVSSSSGNDAWSGKLPVPNAAGSDGPKRTLAAGLGVLRDGYPDWLLLRRGDTWTERLPIPASGRSLTEPVVVSSYGDSIVQPMIHGDAGRSNKRTSQLTNVVVAHLQFEGTFEGSLIGFSGTDNLLIEGCRTENRNVYGGGTPNKNWRIRRNVLVNEGFYLTQINGLLVEENVVYKPVNHAMYITRGGNSNVVTRGNLVLKIPAAEGVGNQNAIMQRPGGLAEGNVVAGSRWYGIVMGSCNDGESSVCQPAVAAEVRGNLVLDGVGIGGGIGVGGDDLILPGARVVDNMVVNSTGSALISKGTDRLVQGNIFFNATPGIAPGRNMRWINNQFYATDGRLLVSGDDLPVVSGFVAQGNRFYANTAATSWFTIPQRVGFAGWKAATGETGSGSAYTFASGNHTLAAYNASLGGIADRDAFFREALSQLRFSYRRQYSAAAVIAYFRAGFASN